MMVAVVVGLEPTDVKATHTGSYHGSIYKVGESPRESRYARSSLLRTSDGVVAVLVNGRKYINRQFVFSDSETVL